MANPPPPQVQKKKGLGCLGCGCLILFILAVLAGLFIVGSTYMGYRSIYALTSPDPVTVPSFDGGDDAYNAATQKITAFNQNVQTNQPASLQLSADELNTLIARNASLSKLNFKIFVSINDNQAHVQTCLPLDGLLFGLFKGRYLNLDTTFGFNLDTDNRQLRLTLVSLKMGDQTLPDADIPLLQQEFEQLINAQMQKNPYLKKILDRATALEIKGGQFNVETN
jgi:hypothetical protein